MGNRRVPTRLTARIAKWGTTLYQRLPFLAESIANDDEAGAQGLDRPSRSANTKPKSLHDLRIAEQALRELARDVTALIERSNRPHPARARATARRMFAPRHWRQAAPWLALPPAAILVAIAYRIALRGDSRIHFSLFWLGLLLVLIPIAVRSTQRRTTTVERLGLLVVVGVFTWLPKELHGGPPIYFDEFLHWRQATTVRLSGNIFSPSPVLPILGYYPGFASMVAWIEDLGGISNSVAAVILIPLFHVLTLIAIYRIGATLFKSERAGSLAAIFYAISPSFMFFNSQFAYESYALVLFVWAIAACVEIERSPDTTWAWLGIALLMVVALVPTHHVTSYALVLLLVAWTGTLVAQRRTSSFNLSATRSFLLLTVTAIVLNAAWIASIASTTYAYLSPHVEGGLLEFQQLLRQDQGSRTLFQNAPVPGYEHSAGLITPVLLLLAAAASFWVLRRKAPSQLWAHPLFAFGLLYFASLPLILTQSGAEVARRSWAFSFVGLAPLLAGATVIGLDRLKKVRSRDWRRFIAVALTAVAAVIMVGNIASDLNAIYRFPGPYVYQSDARSVTPELLAAARWFGRTQGPYQGIVADRQTGVAFSAFGLADPAIGWRGLPIWNLYYRRQQGPHATIRQLQNSSFRYLVIDRRIASAAPYVGENFNASEPAFAGRVAQKAAIDQYQTVPWATAIYATDNLTVYKLDLTRRLLR